MEDPVSFDVWARVSRGAIRDAATFVAAWQPQLTALEVHSEINRSIVQGDLILIARQLTWSQSERIRHTSPEWATDIHLYQEDYGPDDWDSFSNWNNYCDRHALYFGGCLGCHVCNGYYLP